MIFSFQRRITMTIILVIIGLAIITTILFTTYQFSNPQISRTTLEHTRLELLEKASELKEQAAQIASNCNTIYSDLEEQLICHIEGSKEIKKEMESIKNKIIEIDNQLESLELN